MAGAGQNGWGMQIPVKAIWVFHAAARAGSISRAAEEFGVTPSSVTQQIQALEVQLGVSLLTKMGRRVVNPIKPAYDYCRADWSGIRSRSARSQSRKSRTFFCLKWSRGHTIHCVTIRTQGGLATGQTSRPSRNSRSIIMLLSSAIPIPSRAASIAM